MFTKFWRKKILNLNAKFGISYVLFDGEELFEASLKNVRPYVDYINVVYSPKSYYGYDGNPQIPDILNDLENKKLIDEIIYFDHEVAQSKKKRRKLEVKKRNIGLNAAKKRGINYFMTMDTDEFYDPFAFKKAQEKIVTENITHSYVHILNYGSKPTQRYDKRKYEYYVPFFSKINRKSELGRNSKTPCLTDSTRQISDCRQSKYYVLEDIFMHHMSRVRKNVNFKYKTRKVTQDFDKGWLNDDEGFIEVPNYFDINV